MLLGVIPIICFGILGIFWRKIAKEQEKNLDTSGSYAAHIGLLRRNIGNPCHDVNLHHGVAKLHCGEGLRRGVAIVHNEQISDFCFRTPRIRTPIV